MHQAEYDDTGQLARFVVVRESEWDGDERAWMLALALREDSECGRCGGDLAETLDYDKWAWKPQLPIVCLRCKALQGDQKTYEKHPDHAAMIHRVEKVPRRHRAPGKANRKQR